jgi:hypothetical protein
MAIFPNLSMALQPFCWTLAAIRSFIFYIVGMTPWTGDQPVARPLPAHRTAQTQNKRTQTSMPQVGFEPTIPVFEREKTVHDLDRAPTVIGSFFLIPIWKVSSNFLQWMEFSFHFRINKNHITKLWDISLLDIVSISRYQMASLKCNLANLLILSTTLSPSFPCILHYLNDTTWPVWITTFLLVLYFTSSLRPCYELPCTLCLQIAGICVLTDQTGSRGYASGLYSGVAQFDSRLHIGYSDRPFLALLFF